MSADGNEYDASTIKVLEGAEAVRRRPGMYVGSVGRRGLHNLVYETVGWGATEVLEGRATTVEVTLTPGDGVRVGFDGPAVAGVEEMLTRFGQVPSRRGRSAAVMSMFSLGLFVVSGLSSRFTLEVRREGQCWRAECESGLVAVPFAVRGPADDCGTVVEFQPDASIFETVECDYDELGERLRELALLNPELTLVLADARGPGVQRSERLHFPDGVRDFAVRLGVGDPVVLTGALEGAEATAAVALGWRGPGRRRLVSFVNSEPTADGGTHVAGLRDGLAGALTAYAERHGTAPDGAAIEAWLDDELSAVVALRMKLPEFAGPTWSRLGNAEVRAAVSGFVCEWFLAWLAEHPDRAARLLTHLGCTV